MEHKAIKFSLKHSAPGCWKWKFRVGDRPISGRAEARLELLAKGYRELKALSKVTAQQNKIYN